MCECEVLPFGNAPNVWPQKNRLQFVASDCEGFISWPKPVL